MICLAPETAQHGRFIQRYGRELRRVDVAVTDALIVCHDDLSICSGQVLHLGNVYRGRVAQDGFRVPDKLLADAQRKDDQSPSAVVLYGLVAELYFLHRLSKAEGLEQSPAAAAKRPNHRVPLVRFQVRVDLPWVNVEAALFGQYDL